MFDRLPLCAVVDQDIFCVHGGIPRPVSRDTTRIQDILNVPKVAGINPPYEHEDDIYQQVASDCIWSDPASEEQEMHSVDPTTGYGERYVRIPKANEKHRSRLHVEAHDFLFYLSIILFMVYEYNCYEVCAVEERYVLGTRQ